MVMEAAAKLSTFITAHQALDQGCEVLAVPGHPINVQASGCNMLIRDGACSVRSVDDIIQTLYFASSHPPPDHRMRQDQQGGLTNQICLFPRANRARSRQEVEALLRQILNRLSLPQWTKIS